MKPHLTYIIVLLTLAGFMSGGSMAATPIQKGDRVYIQDRTGRQWDVTQAQTMGFDPKNFQHGIGKMAFSPLDERDLQDSIPSYRNPRVIGIAAGEDAQAYAVSKMRHHEIANTLLEERPVAVAY